MQMVAVTKTEVGRPSTYCSFQQNLVLTTAYSFIQKCDQLWMVNSTLLTLWRMSQQ